MRLDKPSLVFHVGTPKTGTSSLQHALYDSRAELLNHKILYPTLELGTNPPKHQWIVQRLLEEDFSSFEKNIYNIYIEALSKDAKCVILSTEGIYNHWGDFSDEAKLVLLKLSEYFNVKIWCVFREPVAYSISFYAQLVKNSPNKLTSLYGTYDLPELVIESPWFKRHLDYAGFVKEIEVLFGYPVVNAIRYEDDDIVMQINKLLCLETNVLHGGYCNNSSLSALGIDLMRRLNFCRLENAEHQKYRSEIIELDNLLGKTSSRLQASHVMRGKVFDIFSKSEDFLSERFNISWNKSFVVDEEGK